MIADLHCHTKLSDGSTSIDEIILLAKKMGIGTISVTDHDTFAGSKRAKIIGQRYGINVVMGAEFSSFDYKRHKEIHILCYMCDFPDRLEGLCKKIGQSRQKAAAYMLQKIMRFYPISPEMVSKKAQGSTNVFKNHIVQAIMDAGYVMANHGVIFEKLFNPINGIAKLVSEYPDTSDVIEQIHEAGGLAVLAHPDVSDGFDFIEDLIYSGLDGIEVWHPGVDKNTQDELQAIATEHSIAMTGGSNFHGMYTSSPRPLGTCITPENQIEELKRRKEKLYKVSN